VDFRLPRVFDVDVYHTHGCLHRLEIHCDISSGNNLVDFRLLRVLGVDVYHTHGC
jgi:hypothetical protein